MRLGRADRFLAPKSEGERDLVSPGMVAAGCRRPDGPGGNNPFPPPDVAERRTG